MTAIGAGDDISRELDAMSSQSDVEAELARLKSAAAPQAIESPVEGGEILKAEPEAVEGKQDPAP